MQPSLDDDALEKARARSRARLDAASSGPSILDSVRDFIGGITAENEARGRQLARDIEEGKRRRQAAMSPPPAAPGPPASSPSLNAIPSPPLQASPTTFFSRSLAGFNAAFPIAGVLAIFSTAELMRAEQAGFSIDVLTRGCGKGVARWIPVGLGLALFYGLEHALRAPLSGAAAPAGGEPPSSVASLMIAGGIGGLGASSVPYALAWPGMRSPAAVSAITAAGAVGALFAPSLEELRGPLTATLLR